MNLIGIIKKKKKKKKKQQQEEETKDEIVYMCNEYIHYL